MLSDRTSTLKTCFNNIFHNFESVFFKLQQLLLPSTHATYFEELFHIYALFIQYLKLRALQRQSYTHYFYEATVGAGLPIVSTLRGLLETGDKILQIEGIFRFALMCYFSFFV